MNGVDITIDKLGRESIILIFISIISLFNLSNIKSISFNLRNIVNLFQIQVIVEYLVIKSFTQKSD